MLAAISCTVRGHAAVPPCVCNLGLKDLEKTTIRHNLVVPVRHQRLSILQPFNVWDWVTWKIIKKLPDLPSKKNNNNYICVTFM